MDQGDSTPPPPAYTEQDFDHKVSTALEVSLITPQPQHGDEEEWEEWDDAVHATAAQAVSSFDNSTSSGSGSSQSLGAGSSARYQGSQLPDKKGPASHGHLAIEPLRIQKKAQKASHSPSNQSKPRPSWFSETETGTQPSAAGSSTLQHDIPPEDEEDRSIPPPPFTPAAPSLDGQPIIVMAYHPSGESRPPSPLNSPIRVPLEISAHDHESMSLSRPPPLGQPDQPQSHVEQFHANSQTASLPHRPARRSLPTVPHPSYHAGQRPSTAQRPSIPRMKFDPYKAYNQERGLPHAQVPTQHFEPSAFYNSAVSAHISAAKFPARQSHLLGTSGQQSPYHFHPTDNNPGRQSVLHDSHTTTGHHVPVALIPGSRNADPWLSSSSANMSVYSQSPWDARYSPNPQHRPR